MALGLNPFIKSLVATVFVVFLVFTFIGNFIAETNPDSEILSSKYGINKSRQLLNDTIEDFSTISNTVYDDLSGSDPSPTDFLFLIFRGAFTIPLAFVNFAFNGLQVISLVLFPTFQGAGMGIILTAGLGIIIASLVVTIVLLIVKAIRTGEAER